MSLDEINAFERSFYGWFKGNQNAVELCLDYFMVCHVWDDLIDKDKPTTDRQISKAFKTLIHKIPNNPFYKQYSAELTPVLMNIIMQWEAANTLDHGDKTDQSKAYMLRAGMYHLISHITLICGGYGWQQYVGADIYRLYDETIQSIYEVKDA